MSGLNSAGRVGLTGWRIVRKSEASIRGIVMGCPLLVVAAFAMTVNATAIGATLSSSTRLNATCGVSGTGGRSAVEFKMRDNACLTNTSVPCVVRYAVSYRGLSSNAIEAHLYNSSACGERTAIRTFPLDAATSGFAIGTIELNKFETEALFNLGGGFLSFDVRTVGDVDGERRGDLGKDPFDVVPTVSQWGLIGLTLLLMTAGTLVIARSWRRFAA